MKMMAQVGVFAVISPMEASHYGKRNLLSPPHPSSCPLPNGSVSLFHSHFNTRNPSFLPPPATLSQEKHQALSTKCSSDERNDLQEAAKFLSGIAQMRPFPSNFEIGKALGTLAKKDNYSSALFHYVSLLLLGIQLNFSILNIAIHCYCQVNQVGFAFSLLGFQIKRGFTPSASTFTALICGLILQRKTTEAVELFNKLSRKRVVEPDVVMYGAIVKGVCKTGNTRTAIEFLRIMEEEGCKPNTVIYNTIITGLFKNRMADDAMNFLLEMNGKGIRPNVFTYTSLIHGLVKCRKWNVALQILREMLDSDISPDVRTFNVLVDGLTKQRMTKEAEGLLDVMRERGVDSDVATYTSLMNGYCLQGRMDEAMRVFDTMMNRGIRPDFFCNNVVKKFMPKL